MASQFSSGRPWFSLREDRGKSEGQKKNKEKKTPLANSPYEQNKEKDAH